MSTRLRALDWLLRAGFWLPLAICTWLALAPKPPELPVFKLGDVVLHAFAFTYLSFAFLLAYQSRSMMQCAALMFGYGLLIELVQSFEVERSAELKDLAVDLAGILAGLLLAKFLVSPLRRMLAGWFGGSARQNP